MTLHALRVDVRADPLRVARTLADEPGFAFLWDASRARPSYVACRPIAFSAALDPEPALGLLPEENPLAEVPRWVGLLPYECRRGLERGAWTRRPDERAGPHVKEPLWCRYGAVASVGQDVLVVGDDRAAVRYLAAKISSAKPSDPIGVRAESVPSEPDEAHSARIRRALELIVEGQIYQVNLARRFEFRVTGRAQDLVERLAGRSGSPFAIAFDVSGLTVAGGSPELFLELDRHGGLLTTPIKGTRPRGRDARADAELAQELDLDPKERAELSMVVDVERNDLGRIARTGSVRARRAPRVETFGTVHHRLADVVARLRPGVTRTELLEAMLPSGSVTGAPKIRAMEVIATLESARRGLYTGAFGSLGHDGSLRLGMAIRVLTRRGDEAHYFAGGGIVFESDPLREVLETRWKAVQVHGLLDGFPGVLRSRGDL